jgi:hypothetical protein
MQLIIVVFVIKVGEDIAQDCYNLMTAMQKILHSTKKTPRFCRGVFSNGF